MLERSRLVYVAVISIACSIANAVLAVEPLPSNTEAPKPAPRGPGSVSYSSSPGCPSEADFWREVASHLQAVPKPSVRPIQVEAFQIDAGSFARVTFAGEGSSRDVRELTAPSCAEAVAAAALVVALALDVRVGAEPPAPRAERQPSRPVPPDSNPFPDRPSSSSKDTRDFELLFGGGGFVEYALAPAPLFGATAFAGVSGAERRWDARAGFAYSRTGTVERDAQAAEFSFIGARIDGCAFPLIGGARFALHPCLAVALGSVKSRGADSELYRGSEHSTVWAAGGPLIRARQLFSELSLELYAGPWIPLAGTKTFIFRRPEGKQTFHEVPPVGVMAGASLAFAVP